MVAWETSAHKITSFLEEKFLKKGNTWLCNVQKNHSSLSHPSPHPPHRKNNNNVGASRSKLPHIIILLNIFNQDSPNQNTHVCILVWRSLD